MVDNNNIKITQNQISFTSSYFFTKKFIIIVFFILGLSNLLFNLFYGQKNLFGELKLENETSPSNIPTPILSNDNDTKIVQESRDGLINRKYCGKDECKFLLAYHLLEQETQANMHFESSIQIAQRLNRTVVLPNVGGSRMHVCRPFPFSFYYDIDGLQQIFPTVQFITQQDFMKWTKELEEKPDTFHAHIAPRGKPFFVENEEPKINLNNKLQTNSKVLLIKHNLPMLLFNDTLNFPVIPYSKNLINIQNNIMKKLDNYLAIHWRIENSNIKLLSKCSTSLVSWIKNFTLEHKIDNIYFATDYPLHGNYDKAQSASFYNIREEHHQAIRTLNSTIKLNTWISLNALDDLKNDDDEKIKWELEGSGVQGILDKLVLINADWFVSGPRGCARIQSRFTRRIKNAREKLINSGNTKIKNISTVWSLI
ncbi:unnamed protein product [Rhizophagus irregularis]|nr:unnamed protein product [Rhizophagus irregularis]